MFNEVGCRHLPGLEGALSVTKAWILADHYDNSISHLLLVHCRFIRHS